MPGKIQKCGLCKHSGHNRRSCPNKDTIRIEKVNIKPINPNFNIEEIEYIDSREYDFVIENQQEELNILREKFEIQMKVSRMKKLKEIHKIKFTNNEDLNKFIETLIINEEFVLWYSTQESTGECLHYSLMYEKKRISLAVAEPGVGKTNLIHYLIYKFKCSSVNEDLIVGDRITIATGMSSVDWMKQTEDGTMLRDGEIYHRDTIHKRIKHLQENPELLSDHIFILDECHIACDKGQTLDKLFNINLGLTKEIMDKLHIKFIFISATPDILQAELIEKFKDEWDYAKLEPGKDYRGCKFIEERGWLKDYDDLKINYKHKIKEILKNYKSPKYHIIRIRGKKGEVFKKNIIELCGQENIGIYSEHNEKNRIEGFDEKLKDKPDKHHFIFIKDFFRASKRLRLTKNIGMIIEPSVNDDVTVVAQSLLARFFGYYPEEEINFEDPPMFICKKECIETYIKYAEGKFELDGVEMNSRKLKPIKNKDGEIKVKTRGNNESFADNYCEDDPNTEEKDESALTRTWLDPYGIDSKNVPNELWLYDNSTTIEDIRQKDWKYASADIIEIIKPSNEYPFYSIKTNIHTKFSFNSFGKGGGADQTRNMIVYESMESNRFIVRKFKIARAII